MNPEMKLYKDIQTTYGDKDYFLIYQRLQIEQVGAMIFNDLDSLNRNNITINSTTYKIVYAAELTPYTTLAEIYQTFHQNQSAILQEYTLRFCDVIVLYRNGYCTPYLVDSTGFVPIPDFFPDLEKPTENTKEPEIEVLVVEPRKAPYFKRIANTTDSLEREVDGTFQAIYPYKEYVAIISDEEALFKRKPLNRALYSEDGIMYDVLKGTFLITGIKGTFFSSLTEKDGEFFFKKFQNPQIFVPTYSDTSEIQHEWSDDSNRGCSDCPDDECTGHCMSCFYRSV